MSLDLFSLRSYRHQWLGLATAGVAVYASLAFNASFFLRSYEVSAGEAGLWLGLTSGIAGLTGSLAGGWLADRISRRAPDRVLWLPTACFAIAAPLHVLALLSPAPWLNVLFAFPAGVALSLYVPPVFSVAQSLVGPGGRAMAAAILLLGMSLVGASAGPFLVGWGSDLLRLRFDRESLRVALCCAGVFYVWAAVHMGVAAASLKDDLVRVRRREAERRASGAPGSQPTAGLGARLPSTAAQERFRT